MVAVRLGDHRIVWKREIDPSHAGNGKNGTYIVAAEQQRAALSLVDGRVPMSSPAGSWATAPSITAMSCPCPSPAGNRAAGCTRLPRIVRNAIWTTSGAAANASGDLFVATGNGAHGPGQSFDYGDAVIKLSPSLKVMSYFAPFAWAYLNDHDLDLGSDGPTLLPGEALLFHQERRATPRATAGPRRAGATC